MTQVSAGVAPANHAIAGRVRRALVFSVLFTLDVEPAFAGEKQAVARGARGQHAIHHVHAHARILLDFVWIADAHDITRLVIRQKRKDFGDHLQRQVARLAHAEAANGVAVEVHLDKALGALAAQVAVHAALDDAEEVLRTAALFPVPGNFFAMGAEMVERAASPGHGEAEAFFGAAAIRGVLGALVEGHRDVGAEGDLDVHGMFRGKKVRTSVEVRAEAHALVADLAQLAERENLKAAGVGEQRAWPADEAVQPAHAADGFVTGTQIEMVGIAEDNLGVERFEHVLRYGFDGAGGAHRHEYRGFDCLVRQDELGSASASLGLVEQVELEGHSTILAGRPMRGLSWFPTLESESNSTMRCSTGSGSTGQRCRGELKNRCARRAAFPV